MKALQIIFLISFAITALILPYLIFSLLQGENTTPLIVFISVIFGINAVLIIRKLLSRKRKKEQ